MATVTHSRHRPLRYEDRLNADPDWAITEGSRFFMGEGEVRATLDTVTRRLNELQVPYAVVGGLALVHHGHRRFTEDVDILVTRESLRLIHDRLDGLGFIPPFPKSKNLKDTSTGVKVEFLLTGAYPGDGKPKPVSFPDPATVSEEAEGGIHYLRLPTLVELKLASGLSAPDRVKDLADVQALIKARNLPRDFADQLDPSVRDGYLAQWQAVNGGGRRYALLWMSVPLPTGPTLQHAVTVLESSLTLLRQMKADGVTLDPAKTKLGEYLYLTTSDPAIAQKYGMEDEADLWDQEEPGAVSGSPDHV